MKRSTGKPHVTFGPLRKLIMADNAALAGLRISWNDQDLTSTSVDAKLLDQRNQVQPKPLNGSDSGASSFN
jgi:hypothetical protein